MTVVNGEVISGPNDPVAPYAEIVMVAVVIAMVMPDVARPIMIQDMNGPGRIVSMGPDRTVVDYTATRRRGRRTSRPGISSCISSGKSDF